MADLRRRGVLGRERERVVILKAGELAEAGARPGRPEEDETPYLPVHPDGASEVIVGEGLRRLQA